jgi:hypothetical protein
MRKEDSLARINVSVPDGLRERMAALDKLVNWSEVAQVAFEREVSARTFKGGNMTEVIERIRASKAQFEQLQASQGRRHGAEWAQLYADYDELRRIAKLRLIEHGEAFAYQFDLALGNDPREDGSFWIDEDTGRIEYPSDAYVEAYVEGVMSVWNEVEGHL